MGRRVAGAGIVILASTGASLLALSGVPVGPLIPGTVILDLRPESGGGELLTDGTWSYPSLVCVDDPAGPIADDAVLFGVAPAPLSEADLEAIRAAAVAEAKRIEGTRWTFTDPQGRVWDLSVPGRVRLFTTEHHDQVTPGSGFPRTLLSQNGVAVTVAGRTAYNAVMSPITGEMVRLDELANGAEVAIRLASTTTGVVSALLAYRS